MSGRKAVGSRQISEVTVGRPRITLIVAASENHVIGRDGDLPWKLPADLARFKKLTMGHPLIMGRKTYESIGRPLPGRVSIVLTRDPSWQPGNDAVLVAGTLNQAMQLAKTAAGTKNDTAFVIGGGEIYRLALSQADCVELTRVHATVDGDATFGPLDPSEWRLATSEQRPVDDKNEHACTFEVWKRLGD